MTENRENVNNAAAVDGGVNNKTLADIVAEMRRGTNLPGYWRSCDLNEILQYHANHIEAAAKRAYHDVDVAVCSIDCAARGDIDNVRMAMDRTLGVYYE